MPPPDTDVRPLGCERVFGGTYMGDGDKSDGQFDDVVHQVDASETERYYTELSAGGAGTGAGTQAHVVGKAERTRRMVSLGYMSYPVRARYGTRTRRE